MLKTMYQAINQVSGYYLGHYKNMLLSAKDMVSPLMNHANAVSRAMLPTKVSCLFSIYQAPKAQN